MDLRDMVREFKEMKEESRKTLVDGEDISNDLERLTLEGDGDGEEEEEDDDDVFLMGGGGDERCGPEEVARIDVVVKVIERVMELYKVLLRLVDTVAISGNSSSGGGGGSCISSEEGLVLAGEVYKACDELTMGISEMGDALYPPQVAEEVEGRMEEVIKVVEQLVVLAERRLMVEGVEPKVNRMKGMVEEIRRIVGKKDGPEG